MSTSASKPRGFPPREYRLGGYCISSNDAARWGSRLFGMNLHPITNGSTIRKVIFEKTYPLGINFREVGETEIGVGADWMLITQGERFNGYKDMDPAEIPQFVPGELDKVAKRLLDEAGIKKYKFATVLD